MKGKIIAIVIILLLVGGSIFNYISNKTVLNQDTILGNTSGNLMNDGLFCEYKNKIYFSNSNDSGALYVMDSNCENFKKLHSDTVSNLNVAGKYIIYARNNTDKATSSENFFSFHKTGLYRVDKKGNHTKTLYESPVGIAALSGNYVYYQHYNKRTGIQLYKVRLDDKEGEKINESAIAPLAIANQTLYYVGVGDNHNIYQTDLTTNTTTTLYEGNCSHLVVQDNFIYFFDLENNHALSRMELDGSNPTALVKERCSTYNVSSGGNYIYYQRDDGEKNGIYRYDIKNDVTASILEGDFNCINVTTDYVFFQEFNTTNTYMFSSQGDLSVSKFEAPVLK